MTLHAVLLAVGDVVGILAGLNFLIWAPLEKSWRLCCLRAGVPVAVWSALRLGTIVLYREPFENPLFGFFIAPLMAMGYAVLLRAGVRSVVWARRMIRRKEEWEDDDE